MKKFSKSYIYYHLIVDFIIIFFIMLCFGVEFFSEEEGFKLAEKLPQVILVFFIIFLVVYALKTVYSVLYVNASGYELKENEIECKRGVFFKKRSILEYYKIHAVNKKQNLFHRIFKLAVLTLDSGSTNTAYASEILIVEKEKEVDKIVEEIKLRQSGEKVNINSEIKAPLENKENLYKFTAKRKVIYSLLNVLSTVAVLLFISIIILATYYIVLPLAIKSVSGWDAVGIVIIAVYSLIIYFIITLIVFIVSILASFLSYYKFSVYKNSNDIEINYGFFVKSNNTFKLNKIKGVVVSQGLIKRLFGFVTVKLEVIGYNEATSDENSSKSTGILFPLCKENELEENLKKVLPDFIPDKMQEKAKKYFPFISWTMLIFSVAYIFAVGIALFNLLYFKVDTDIVLTVIKVAICGYIIVSGLILVNGYLSYKNNGITILGDKISVYGGGFTKTYTVIKRSSIIAIEDITTPLRKKSGIYSYLIHFRSNDQTNVIRLNNVDVSLANKLYEIVKY